MEALRRPRGRPPSRSWAFFTTETEPQKLSAATCRHCEQSISHHKKWGQARTHLMKCAPFLQLMESLPPADVPEWYLAEITRRQQSVVMTRNLSLHVPIFQDPTQNAAFKSIQPMPGTAFMQVPNAGKGTKIMVEKVKLTKIEENVAMHLFTTFSVPKFAEAKLDISHLTQAFQAFSPGFILPENEKLMTEVLDRCYDKVKAQVNGFFNSGLVPVSLSLENVPASRDGGLVTIYMASLASSDKYPMYLESTGVPTGEDVNGNAGWAANNLAGVVEKLSCPVAGCVIPCSSSENREMRQLLETQFPHMYFHGCVRDALLAIIQQVFVQAEGGEMTPFCRDLQQFALQCQDLAYFAPDKETPSYFHDIATKSQDIIHVTVRRRLTVREGFIAILQAETFLNVEALENHFFSSGNVVTVMHKQLLEFVRSPKFSEKLRKYLDVVRPLHQLLSAFQGDFNSSPLPLSEVYSCFSKLSTEFSASTLLVPEEKAALQALAQHQQEYVVGTAHELAYLLDPVLLGEDFSDNKQSEVEQKLLSSVGANGSPLSDSDKSTLLTQYKAFHKTTMHLKTVKAGSVEFQELKTRKKSPLQFWFSDGAKWPALQVIACRVFVMPACTVNSTPLLSEMGLPSHVHHPELGPSRSDKLAFIRVNTRQLQLAEVGGSSLASIVPNLQNDRNSNDITASMVV